MLIGTVLRLDNIFYEVLDVTNEEEDLEAPARGVLVREVRLPNKKGKSITLSVLDKSTRFKQYRRKKFGPDTNEYQFIKIKTPRQSWPMTNYRVRKKAVDNTSVDFRLSLNNILARMFLGRTYAKSALNTLVKMRLGNGKTESKETQVRNL